MKCKRCGNYIKKEDRFCEYCGVPVKNTIKRMGIVSGLFLLLVTLLIVIILSKETNVENGQNEKRKEVNVGEDLSEEKKTYIEAEDMTEEMTVIENTEESQDIIAAEISMENIIGISASSSLTEKDVKHSEDRLIDNNISAAWVEGATGQGIGETITFYFDEVYTIKGFYINSGYQKSEQLYWKNSRPKSIEVLGEKGISEVFELQDLYGKQDVVFSMPIVTDEITITIKSVYEGTKYDDTVISEIYFY